MRKEEEQYRVDNVGVRHRGSIQFPENTDLLCRNKRVYSKSAHILTLRNYGTL